MVTPARRVRGFPKVGRALESRWSTSSAVIPVVGRLVERAREARRTALSLSLCRHMAFLLGKVSSHYKVALRWGS
jgi:hypothetical protein